MDSSVFVQEKLLNISGKSQISNGKFQKSRKFQNNASNGIKQTLSNVISTRNHMFKREIWDKLQKMNEVNFPQISRIYMWFLVNQM